MLRTLPEPIIPEANQYGLKIKDFKHETLPLSVNELNANINNMNYDFSDNAQPTIDIVIDTTIHCNIPENIEDYITGIISDLDLPEISKEIPSSISIQVTPHENNVEISSLALPIDLSFLNGNENKEPPVLYQNSISDVCSLTTINYPPKLPQSAFPATYINTSPTYGLSQISANAVSSLNNVVSSLTQTILNSFISYLTSAQSQVTNTVCPIPYTTSSLDFYNTNLMKPCVPQYLYTSKFSPSNSYSTTTFSPLEPQFYNEIPSTTINTYSNDLTTTTSVTSSPPLKVTLLPPTSFLDYLPSQPCPSTLPLPTLPSYLDISSPFTPKPQVFNVKPLDRRAKTVERLLDMVFLSELLHGEGYIDWDALDTVLAILYAS
ncbi:unnamed protein product [Arctia plantaginis]|uniref:Uncharacterized protein n=1 Tax=Arctia plantaginis TaxID=874455 RepID=A0A8S1AB02_ARCPL|nr:unnamed protein product [Arctia plantaginis]